MEKMNKCIVQKRFICGVGHDQSNIAYHDYDCDKSGLEKGDITPCKHRKYMMDGKYDCECIEAIMEAYNGK